jgi:hypothetical protein
MFAHVLDMGAIPAAGLVSETIVSRRSLSLYDAAEHESATRVHHDQGLFGGITAFSYRFG